ncbi:MAG: penicillin-binding protein activator LpoB [Phycisphaeraceae bacterium]|nr:penicillin-binding protein activator LpoB [Phycisphaeraceae bacterium]
MIKRTIGKTLCTAALLGATLTGCEKSQRIERVDPGQVLDYQVKFDEDDAREVAHAMIDDALSRPWIDNWLSEHAGKRPVIIVGDILNNTSDYIDSSLFTVAFERDLLNSGRVSIVASSSERTQLRDERAQGQDWSRPDTVKRMAYELGADLMLIGRIAENREVHRNKKKNIRYYQVSLDLIDVESNQKVWIGLHEIEKRGTNIN